MKVEDSNELELGLCLHDGTYGIDSALERVAISDEPSEAGRAKSMTEKIINRLLAYRRDHLLKFVGVGITKELYDLCPQLCSQLWRRLDAVALIITPEMHSKEAREALSIDSLAATATMDAHSAARKCLK